MRRKWDGHCHSQFCPHGKGEATEAMVRQAVALGFERLSLTEHAPLPPGLLEDQRLFDELALRPSEVEPYLEHARALKKKYQGQIEISVGLEVDYLPGYEEVVLDFYRSWGDQLEDSLLSLHFLPGPKEPLMVDFSPEDVATRLLPHYGGLKEATLAYWHWVMESVKLPFGDHRPTRLGHLGLINKFSKVFEPYPLEPEFYRPLALAIAQAGYQLDYNCSGFGRKTCGQAYLPTALLALAQELGIPLVYGSDAHGVQAIGQYYDHYLKDLNA